MFLNPQAAESAGRASETAEARSGRRAFVDAVGRITFPAGGPADLAKNKTAVDLRRSVGAVAGSVPRGAAQTHTVVEVMAKHRIKMFAGANGLIVDDVLGAAAADVVKEVV